ncbi:chondroitin sulfate proteoglycan 5 [Candoia aspera]|uniref:chondroitin sulfate proteoglycan 5 n=1 Tax=Candoia aspera TaxID=51853 RepID=UPI002FD7BA10
MGRPLAASGTPPAALLLALAVLLAASEPRPRFPGGPTAQGPPWRSSQGPATLSSQAPAKELPASPGESPWSGGNASAGEAPFLQAARAKESQLVPPALPRGGARKATGEGGPGDPAASSFPERAEGEETRPGLCPGCSRRTTREMGETDPAKDPGEASSTATLSAQPGRGEDGPWKLLDRGKAGPGSPSPAAGSQEDAGSGDPHAKAPPSPGRLGEWGTALPPLDFDPEAGLAGGPLLSRDSAETDLLLDPAGAPTRGHPSQALEGAGGAPEQDLSPEEEPPELRVGSSSRSPAEGAEGGPELTRPDAEGPRSVVPTALKAAQAPRPSPDPLASEIIDVDYYDLFDGGGLRGPGSDSTKRKPPEEKGFPWAFRDLYDDFTPFDESDFYPTTSFYTDGDEDDLEEPEEDEDEEEEEEEGGGGPARGGVERGGSRGPTLATPKVQGAEPTSRRYILPPLQTFVVSGGGGGMATPRPPPVGPGREASLPAAGSENGTECRSGYIRHNASCRSVCDTFPSYCHNGGQCYLVENLGAFCRCNTQDYIWHKGIRCESIITDFQVMCVAVGSAALVVLLLFMMTVFFAKKLYLLKTENIKLRKSKYRTPSELHNDNFSLSTIAEGSHPNDDPSAPHKLQDPLKSCLKDEESFNIQNSMSPKLDNGKGNPDDSEANSLQNNLT